MQSLFLAISAVLFAGTTATLDFQCWNLKSTNEIRQIIYNRVNALRKDLATGNLDCANSAKCPKGQNIYKLNWDCLLEQEAEKVVEKCDATATGPNDLGMVIKKVPMTTCNPKPLFKQTVDEWFVEQAKKQPANGNSPLMSTADTKDFATLAYGKATRIGCAQKNCNENLIIACMVYGKGPANGESIYEVGEPCKGPNDCTTYEGSKCATATGLCLIGYPKNTTETTTTTTTTPSITTPPVTTPGATTPPPQPSTTLFPPGANSCNNQGHIANNEIRDAFKNAHNKYRGLVARGESPRKGGIARPCCLMYEMKYDCGLEAAAYDIAKQCSPADGNDLGNGENHHKIDNENLAFKDAATQATEAWYNEITSGTLEQGDGQMNYYHSGNGIAHLARMLWFNHKQIGCAIAKCSGFLKVVCHYSPTVSSMEGRQIYKMCPNCNRCPDKAGCLSNQGLCPW